MADSTKRYNLVLVPHLGLNIFNVTSVWFILEFLEITSVIQNSVLDQS